ncbi:thiol-disulfide oxidoreductase DCC family protein [Tabrizicola sp.]|uniref:thiol-disulfide oxidoreductase DCC family protein n=1 Tax=Tabrizicola sp. TaxID=2005166 RepID=UPI003F31D3C6
MHLIEDRPLRHRVLLRAPPFRVTLPPMTKPYSHRNDPAVPPFDDSAPVAVMDADCAICSWGARMIHRLDRTGATRICPVQSPLGTALLQHYGLDPNDPVSWLFLDNGIPHKDFEAVLHAGRRFGGLALLTQALRIFPKPIRTWLYLRLARNRYRLFGRGDMCALPDQAFQRRLLR